MKYRNTLLLLIIAGAAVAGTKTDRDWKLGRVLDSTSSKTTLETGATTNTTTNGSAIANTSGSATAFGNTANGSATTIVGGQSQQTSNTVVHHMTIRETELVIVGQDYAYVIEDPYAVSGPILRRAITNHKHGCRFIIGEDIKYVQEKGKLIVLDPDGKECNLDIIKQERIQPKVVQSSGASSGEVR